MIQDELARRFTTYMDALVAFAVVNLIAFTSAIAEEDVRCAFAHIQFGAIAVNVLMGVVSLLAIRGCDRARSSLLDSSGAEQPAIVRSYERKLLLIRYALVCLATAGAVAAIVGAASDSKCPV